jgi:hypothetical protein
MTGAMPLIEQLSDFDVLSVKGASSRHDRSIGTGLTLNLNLHFLSLDFAVIRPGSVAYGTMMTLQRARLASFWETPPISNPPAALVHACLQ